MSRSPGRIRPDRSLRSRARVALGLGVDACLAACGSQGPEPAGRYPSSIARMVCIPKAQHEIGAVLGVVATVSTPTWSDELYSCRYQYPTGVMTLSVKELSSWSETDGYFGQLERDHGERQPLYGLGQGAFMTRDGSVAVRKDWKVLLVDTSALPPGFAAAGSASPNVAETVAATILACWAGD